MFREEAGRLTASLVRLLGDFDLAEELVSDALVEALEHWPREGVPDRPGAWLLTTARRKGVDRLRREARHREKLAALAALPESPPHESDDRLRLIFTCCHPALARDAQVALTLRAVVGLTTQEIARAFLLQEAALAKQGVLRDGYQLQPARTATTVHWERGKPMVTDGPFMEAKETIGGYGVLDVADLDEALAIARSFPAPSCKVEVRPVVER